jgi:endonuclease/exonuclease/phosphatase family metal-dependent hydrolase
MRVASWNIRKGLGTDRKRHPARILSILDTMDADIMVLQEADFRLGTRLPALPPHLLAEFGFQAVATHPATPSMGWHGNAILLRDGVELRDVHLIHLPGIEPRGALSVEIAKANSVVRVIGVHLGLLRQSRLRQMVHIANVLDDLQPLPTILIGDFNERSKSRGFGPLEAEFRIKTPGPTFHARFPRFALDRLAHNSRVRLSHLDVVNTAKTRLASDHLPIVGQFTTV